MLLSMTGFGRATTTKDDKTITVEVRSLNSKHTDMRFKMPNNYREKETFMRKILTEKAQRGKLDVLIDVKSLEGEEDFALNIPLFKKYYEQLSKLQSELKASSNNDLFQTIMRIPNVVASGDNQISKDEWGQLKDTLHAALKDFTEFRATEGEAMASDMQTRVDNIAQALVEVDPFETARIDRLKTRLHQNLEEFHGKENVDENRFEQEIIYYLEKIDITEEKVRLAQHCKYFSEELKSKDTLKGRKLSFISQEMGREINTLGAKAYSANIQKLVVDMKDELEKIKELVANCV